MNSISTRPASPRAGKPGVAPDAPGTKFSNSVETNSPSQSDKPGGGASPSGTYSPLTSHQLAAATLKLFRAGKDTVEIAKALGIPEARASKLLWVARSRARRLPADFIFRGAVRRILA